MSYCGKKCDQCYQRRDLDCPGCETGPGKPVFGTCKISMCCRGKRYDNCGQCAEAPHCQRLSECAMAPVKRLQQRQDSARMEKTMDQIGPTVAKTFRLIFWLEVLMLVRIGMLELYVWFPGLDVWGLMLQFGTTLACGIVLIRLGAVFRRFRTAGVFMLISGVSIFLANILMGILPLLAALLLLEGMVLSFLGEYQELTGYAQVMDAVDAARADAWRGLWKWFLIVHIVLYVSELSVVFLPYLGSAFYVLAGLGQLAVTVLKLIYLRRSAEYFRYR